MKAIEIFDRSFSRVEGLVLLHQNTLAKDRGRPPAHASDVLRAAIVMGVSAVDTYIHLMLLENILLALDKNSQAPFLVEFCRDLVKDREVAKEGDVLLETIAYGEPREKFLYYVEIYYQKRPLQNPGEIKRVFNIIGIESIWTELANRMDIEEQALKAHFAKIIQRRHAIVHEADLRRRAASPKTNPIDRPTVKEYLDLLRACVSSMNDIIEEVYR